MTLAQATAYFEGDAFQVEKRTVFATEWLPIAFGSQIPEVGDYTANAVGGWPVFALRGADAAVRTFRNACRHQNMHVVENPGGRCTELRCRYHGWTYDLAGRFVTAPAPVAPADPTSPSVHLREVGTAILRDIVLFTLAPAPPPASLGEVDEVFARELGAATPRYAGSAMSEIGCNWKTYIEHALSAFDDPPAWRWPLLLSRPHPAGVVVEQVVPRTFLRTRVVRHLLVPACNAESAVELLQPAADDTKAACEALQAERVAGRFSPEHASIAAFHERLAAAYAADSSA
jgi:nitrite reductase/ring-hydroxylating ferredoxin subunit